MLRSALAIAVAALIAAAPAIARENLVDGIAAQVGPDIVLISEVMAMVIPMEAEMRRAQAPETEIMKLRAEGLERMIEWRLIEQVVRQSDLYATDDEISATIDQIAGETGITRAELEESVEAHGLPFSEYRDQIKRELERRNVIATMVTPRIRIEPTQVEARYHERYAAQPEAGVELHIRQVLVASAGSEERSPEWACATARAAHDRVRAGEPFAVVASETSDVAPERGGDLGWMLRNTLAPWMAELAAELEPGELSDVRELPFGCTFLELADRREYQHVTFEMAREQLQDEVFTETVDAEYREFLEKLRERTYIERKGYFADAARFGPSTFGSDEESSETEER